MELTNEKITNILIVIIIILVLHMAFTIWSYRLLRNKEGPRGHTGQRGPRGFSGR